MNSDQSHQINLAPNSDAQCHETENAFDKAQECSAEKVSQGSKVHREPSAAFAAFLEKMKDCSAIEERIKGFLSFMKDSLSKHENPRFRDFWDARKECLPLFKEQIVQKHRSEMWQQYIDLSTEARRLKEVLDEQSVFAYEQIDLAISSLRAELDSYEVLLEKAQVLDVPPSCYALLKNKDKYLQLQNNLHLLNNFATRINSLRKEVIRTDMRIKNKNKLFERLSQIGECVFPKRKEFIRECSDLFSSDIQGFADKHFSVDAPERLALHQLRDEIKSLQNIAKELTLNPQAFNHTRLKLSECWDKLKVLDKERKKEISQKKQQVKQIVSEAQLKIQAFEEFCKTLPAYSDVTKQFEEILSYMKTLDLSFHEQKFLKDELFKARAPVFEKQRLEQEERQKKEKEQELEKRARIESYKEALSLLLANAESLDLEEMVQKVAELKNSQSSLNLTKADKMESDKLLRQISDKMDEKKEKKIISLSDSDQERHEKLSSLLDEKRQARQEIKLQIESYRKILGGSGFDFEKAMMYRDLIEAEKDRLEKVARSIEEIEEKISEIEG